MATITWPSSIRTGAVDYGVEFDVQINFARNGAVQTFGLPGARWVCSIRFENDFEDLTRPRIESLLLKLKGGANRLSMPHWGRPRPNGTLRGTPTLGAAIAAGAEQLTIVNANGNLKEGDIIGLPGQFVMVTADANPVLTNLTVSVTPPIRAVHNSGTPITWNKPHTLWLPRDNRIMFPYSQNKVRPGFSVDFVEVW